MVLVTETQLTNQFTEEELRKAVTHSKDIIIQSTFNEKQEALLKAGVTKSDAIILQEENRVQRTVQLCRKSHGGPVGTEEEIENMTSLKLMKRVFDQL